MFEPVDDIGVRRLPTLDPAVQAYCRTFPGDFRQRVDWFFLKVFKAHAKTTGFLLSLDSQLFSKGFLCD